MLGLTTAILLLSCLKAPNSLLLEDELFYLWNVAVSDTKFTSKMQPLSSSLILTLKLDQPTFDYANTLRQQHFPPERNLVPAHITLFHALPGEQVTAIEQCLQRHCDRTARIALRLSTLRFLGAGVAIAVDSPELIQLRQALAQPWSDWLKPQDRQGYRPHITIQNKVPPTFAQLLYDQLLAQWQPLDGYGEGLLLWYYRNGPWELAQEFPFQESPPDGSNSSNANNL